MDYKLKEAFAYYWARRHSPPYRYFLRSIIRLERINRERNNVT